VSPRIHSLGVMPSGIVSGDKTASETAPPDEAETHALPPEQLKQFIAAGFLELPPSPSAPPEVHAAIAAMAHRLSNSLAVPVFYRFFFILDRTVRVRGPRCVETPARNPKTEKWRLVVRAHIRIRLCVQLFYAVHA